MGLKEAIMEMLKFRSSNRAILCRKIGYKNQGTLETQLNRGDVKLSTFFKMCEAYDYEITIQPKGRKGSRPAGQIVISYDGQSSDGD